jgi:hypothetical protein
MGYLKVGLLCQHSPAQTVKNFNIFQSGQPVLQTRSESCARISTFFPASYPGLLSAVSRPVIYLPRLGVFRNSDYEQSPCHAITILVLCAVCRRDSSGYGQEHIAGPCEHDSKASGSIKDGKFLACISDYCTVT